MREDVAAEAAIARFAATACVSKRAVVVRVVERQPGLCVLDVDRRVIRKMVFNYTAPSPSALLRAFAVPTPVGVDVVSVAPPASASVNQVQRVDAAPAITNSFVLGILQCRAWQSKPH